MLFSTPSLSLLIVLGSAEMLSSESSDIRVAAGRFDNFAADGEAFVGLILLLFFDIECEDILLGVRLICDHGDNMAWIFCRTDLFGFCGARSSGFSSSAETTGTVVVLFMTQQLGFWSFDEQCTNSNASKYLTEESSFLSSNYLSTQTEKGFRP